MESNFPELERGDDVAMDGTDVFEESKFSAEHEKWLGVKIGMLVGAGGR